MCNCHLDTSYMPGAIQRMLFSNNYRKVLFPAEYSLYEEAWNIKTSFKRRQWHLLVWIDWNQSRNYRKSGTKSLTKTRSDLADRTSTCRWILGGERDVIRQGNPSEKVRPKIIIIIIIRGKRAFRPASFPVVLGGCDVTCQACRENSPRTDSGGRRKV